MTEKKEHWKAKEKREREEAQNTEVAEVSTPEIVELEKKVAKLEKARASRPYHVFNARAQIVAYCIDEESADETLKGFAGGWKQMI